MPVSDVSARQHLRSATRRFFTVPRCRLSTLGPRPSLRPARRFGTLYQTAWEIRILAGTASDVCWRRFYLQCSLRCFRTIRSTNWLTYLFGNLRLKNVRTLSLLLYFYNQKAILNILSTTFYVFEGLNWPQCCHNTVPLSHDYREWRHRSVAQISKSATEY